MSLAENLPTQSSDADQTVQRYGYRQEFRRELKRFASFAVGFSFISTNDVLITYQVKARCEWMTPCR